MEVGFGGKVERRVDDLVDSMKALGIAHFAEVSTVGNTLAPMHVTWDDQCPNAVKNW